MMIRPDSAPMRLALMIAIGVTVGTGLAGYVLVEEAVALALTR